MPKSVGRVKSSFTITFPRHVIVERFSPSVAANTPELALTPIRFTKGESILIDAFWYFFTINEPDDQNNCRIYFTTGDTSNGVGDTLTNNDALHQSSFWSDYKHYQIDANASWFEQGTFIDIAPDVLINGDDDVQLEVWVEPNATKTVVVDVSIHYIREVLQTNYPNDNAFQDYLWDEIVGNVV